MASLEDGATMANDPVFISRVGQATSQNAYLIITSEEDTVPDHAQRLDLAQRVANDPNGYSTRFSRMVVGNPTIAEKAPDQASVLDNEIEFAVNQSWPAFFTPALPTPPAA